MKEALLKLAACKSRMTVPQTREGRRSMRVSTLLRKEKEGTLYKAAMSHALEAGGPHGTATPTFAEKLRGSPLRSTYRKGDVPSLHDSNWSEERTDGRASAVTQVSPSTQTKDVFL